MTLNDLLAQIELLSDADKRILINETIQMLSAEANGSSASKVIAEVALADAYVVERPHQTHVNAADDAYLAALRARFEARQAQLPAHPDLVLKRGILKGMVFNDEDFRLAEWHPTEEQLRGHA